MKIFLLATTLSCCLFQSAFCDDLSKEEKKRLKAELKGYLSDLSGYKANMQDIRATLDSNDVEIKQLKEEIAACSTRELDLQNKVADYDKELQRCNDEMNKLQNAAPFYGDTTKIKELLSKDTYDPKKVKVTIKNIDNVNTEDYVTEDVNKTADKANGDVAPVKNKKEVAPKHAKGHKNEMAEAPKDMNVVPETGVTYKVQIGLFKNFNINKYFEEPRCLGYEEVDGMNRYIISSFTNQQTAVEFVGDIRKMGIKDAFVAKYVDGKRVMEYSKKQKGKVTAE